MWTLLQFHEIYVTNWRAICVYEMYLMTQGCIEYHKLTAGMVDRQAQKHTQLESRRYQRWQYKPQPGRCKNHWKPGINHGLKTGQPSLVQVDEINFGSRWKSIHLPSEVICPHPQKSKIYSSLAIFDCKKNVVFWCNMIPNCTFLTSLICCALKSMTRRGRLWPC